MAKSRTNLPATRITPDPARTAARVAELDAYFRKHVFSPRRFRCPHFAACRATHPGTFFDGQLHHVGAHYDLTVNEVPTRIVVVGQEYGAGPARATLAIRSEKMRRFAHEYRFCAEPGFAARNPHMRGTTSLLRLLFGKPLGTDYAGEFLDLPAGRVHLFDAFALVNFLLCSAVAGPAPNRSTGGQRGMATTTMWRDCAPHFRRALEILQPTIIVVQGTGVRYWMRSVLDEAERVARAPHVERVRFGDNGALLATFVHPACPTRDNWGANTRQSYLRRVIAPSVRVLRRTAGSEPTKAARKKAPGGNRSRPDSDILLPGVTRQ